ncbi:hypothetical protein GCM10023205_33890 [Yinghuangia aomiensis]|uniref:Uncharacterized protein n=1 Tax=Yinghuangia aomiensis TaxID=676205 RepID=A0ABP9HBI8_9ACTN
MSRLVYGQAGKQLAKATKPLSEEATRPRQEADTHGTRRRARTSRLVYGQAGKQLAKATKPLSEEATRPRQEAEANYREMLKTWADVNLSTQDALTDALPEKPRPEIIRIRESIPYIRELTAATKSAREEMETAIAAERAPKRAAQHAIAARLRARQERRLMLEL